MFVESSYLRGYLFSALEAGPETLECLLAGLTPEEADRRPDPARFNLREVMAHLADWENVFLERMRRMVAEHNPTIPGYDEGQRAVERNYAATDPLEQWGLFRDRRSETVAFLRALPLEAWSRTAVRPEIGAITLEAQALMLPLHDAYHVRQVIQWRAAP